MRAWLKTAIKPILPLAVAALCISLEPSLTALAQSRPGILPAAMFALAASLLLPRARQFLIATLCFGIALLALRDTFRIVSLPAAIDYVFVEVLYPYVWASIALLAGGAGAAEALRPNSVWARRCYFAAAALYLCGHGLISFLKSARWESLALLASGLFAFVGIFLSHRIVANEQEASVEDEDIRALAAHTAQRAAVVASREWKEKPEELSHVR